MAKKIQGIFTSLITPFRKDNLKVDIDSLMDLVSFVGDHGGNGIIPLGSYGEFNSLTLIERKEVLASIMESRGDLAVIPNVGCDNFEETLELANYARSLKVDAVLIMPPYFYKDVETTGLINYFLKIMKNLDLPVYIYNIPKYTGIEINDTLIEALLETGKLAGIKDASGDISLIKHFKSKYPDLNIILANDKLFYDGLSLGLNTFSSYLFNAFPEIVKAVSFDYNQPVKGGKAAQIYLNEVHHLLKKYPRIAALKYSATLRGISGSDVRPPLTGLTKEQENSLKISVSKYINNPSLIH